MAKTVGLTFNEKPITIEPPADYRENENVIDYKLSLIHISEPTRRS